MKGRVRWPESGHHGEPKNSAGPSPETVSHYLLRAPGPHAFLTRTQAPGAAAGGRTAIHVFGHSPCVSPEPPEDLRGSYSRHEAG